MGRMRFYANSTKLLPEPLYPAPPSVDDLESRREAGMDTYLYTPVESRGCLDVVLI